MGRTEATVAKALARAHAALLEDLRKLKESARPASGEGLEGLRTRLAATQTHVTEHFRFEEQNGYMDAVRNREPRLERTIGHLADDHRQLARSLEMLIERARTATALDDPLRVEVSHWVGSIRKHEARENDLMRDAFNMDIGAED